MVDCSQCKYFKIENRGINGIRKICKKFDLELIESVGDGWKFRVWKKLPYRHGFYSFQYVPCKNNIITEVKN